MTLSHHKVIRNWIERENYTGHSNSIIACPEALYSCSKHFPLVVRNKHGILIANTDSPSMTIAAHQSICRRLIDTDISFSFSALERLKIDVFTDKFILLDKFASSFLFEVINRREKVKYILYAWDTESAYNRRPAFFICVLPKKAKTIKEAYELLKPREVKEFEKKSGQKALRQGEWFFIPKSGLKPKEEHVYNSRIADGAHCADKLYSVNNNEIYVKGKIKHLRGEHKSLYLKDWHKVIKNTAIMSASFGGRID